jgi:hypothetical protein
MLNRATTMLGRSRALLPVRGESVMDQLKKKLTISGRMEPYLPPTPSTHPDADMHFRYPAPGSQPAPVLPETDGFTNEYDTRFHTRNDTIPNIYDKPAETLADENTRGMLEMGIPSHAPSYAWWTKRDLKYILDYADKWGSPRLGYVRIDETPISLEEMSENTQLLGDGGRSGSGYQPEGGNAQWPDQFTLPQVRLAANMHACVHALTRTLTHACMHTHTRTYTYTYVSSSIYHSSLLSATMYSRAHLRMHAHTRTHNSRVVLNVLSSLLFSSLQDVKQTIIDGGGSTVEQRKIE